MAITLRGLAGLVLFVTGLLIAGLHVWMGATAQETPRRAVHILELDGPVGPAIADYIEASIIEAGLKDAELVVIEIDTPGGLDDSMRQIVQSITGASVPVATYVTPSGARSASAGLYIMYAAHVSAMTPGTNTGAATPVQIGGGSPMPDRPIPLPQRGPERPAPESPAQDGPDPAASGAQPDDDTSPAEAQAGAEAERETSPGSAPALSNEDALRAKVVNDASAYIRSLANLHGRNADWAELAVRDAASVSAEQALELGVIDLVATDLDDLLMQVNGREVVVGGQTVTINTGDLAVERVAPDLVTEILAFISNPNVALIFMTIGVYGIIIEMWNPGSIFPGLLGLTSLIIGFYALQVLPVNWMGAALIGVGALLIVLEAFSVTFGLLGLAGLALFAFGAYILFPQGIPGFSVSPWLVGSLVGLGALLLGLILFVITRSRVRGPVIGIEAINRREGTVESWSETGESGHVIVEGERWKALSDQALSPGQRVKVKAVTGLVLKVVAVKA
jgi:membrane-bound serine protease (ClpP class)